jgi:hypothetical protein
MFEDDFALVRRVRVRSSFAEPRIYNALQIKDLLTHDPDAKPSERSDNRKFEPSSQEYNK